MNKVYLIIGIIIYAGSYAILRHYQNKLLTSYCMETIKYNLHNPYNVAMREKNREKMM